MSKGEEGGVINSGYLAYLETIVVRLSTNSVVLITQGSKHRFSIGIDFLSYSNISFGG